jgi:nucleoid-associated protein EbfC
MSDFLNNLSRIQVQMSKVKENLSRMTVEGISAGGKLKVIFDGNRNLKSVVLPENFSSMDSEEIEDLLVIAINDGIAKASALNEQEMQKAAVDMFPGMK